MKAPGGIALSEESRTIAQLNRPGGPGATIRGRGSGSRGARCPGAFRLRRACDRGGERPRFLGADEPATRAHDRRIEANASPDRGRRENHYRLAVFRIDFGLGSPATPTIQCWPADPPFLLLPIMHRHPADEVFHDGPRGHERATRPRGRGDDQAALASRADRAGADARPCGVPDTARVVAGGSSSCPPRPAPLGRARAVLPAGRSEWHTKVRG